MIPQAASDQEVEQDRISTIATRSVRRIWRLMRGRNWEQAWRTDVGPAVQQVVLAAQEATVASTDAYVTAVLAELGIDPGPPSATNIDALIGVAGDGRPVESLTYGSVVTAAKAMYTPRGESLTVDQATREALAEAEQWMDGILATILADSARAAESVATAQRPWVTGYVRMVEPGACSRCIVLAGKFYKYNDGFDRHERCKCRHIPANENLAGDMTTNPDAYFESLNRAEQDKTFTAAGAEAIRLGADMGQVVNARRGMQVAQVHGRRALITTEGTTARGLAGRSMGDLGKIAGQQYRRSRVPRLMPETVLAEAKNPEDAIRLLTRFGYVLS